MRAVWAVLAMLLFVAVPGVTAQRPVESCSEQCSSTDPDVNAIVPVKGGTTNVVLYAHYEDILNMAPLNTVPPNETHESDLNRGFLMPTLDTNTNVCPAEDMCADFHFKNNEFTMYLCPGLITFMDEGWRLGCHSPAIPESLDIMGPMTLYFYLASANPASPEGGPSALPNVRIAARMEAGSREAIVLARGASEPTAITAVSQEEVVYEFKVELTPLDFSETTLMDPAFRRLFFIVEIQQVHSDEAFDTSIGQGWRVRTGPDFPPRVVIPTKDPLRLVDRGSVIRNDAMFVWAHVLPVYGSYDFDSSSVQARIVAPGTGKTVDPRALEFREVRRSVDHDGVLKPANITWRVHPEFLDVGGSVYRVDFEARNLQGTYELGESVPIPVTAFTGQGAPNVPMVLVLGLLAGCALSERRRRVQ